MQKVSLPIGLAYICSISHPCLKFCLNLGPKFRQAARVWPKSVASHMVSSQNYFVLQKKRSRRSLTCSPTLSECCRESFVVSFREIGWDSWIIGPSSYNAYYCKGSCISMNGFVHATKKHTTVMQVTCDSKNINGTKECLRFLGIISAEIIHPECTICFQEYIRTFGITNRTAEIVPCCTASKMSPISVIYRDPNNLNNTLKKEILPDMVVDSCGCK